ncbi:MAG: UMP kinase [Planctomycetota bacterium]
MGEGSAPQRVLLKLSGNVFSGSGQAPFDRAAIDYIAAELAQARRGCRQIAVVVGGGNVIRGASFADEGPGRVRADYAGMLATVMNALMLQEALERHQVPATRYGAVPITRVLPAFEPAAAIADLQEGRVVLLGGGTGNPFFTTDTAAALRGIELEAELLLKATRVPGVYSADPERVDSAEFFPHISYRQVLERRLGVMDLAAVSLCMEHRLPVRVFDYSQSGNLRRAAAGEPLGTLIGSEKDGG